MLEKGLNLINQKYSFSKINFSYCYIISRLVTLKGTENMHLLYFFGASTDNTDVKYLNYMCQQ